MLIQPLPSSSIDMCKIEIRPDCLCQGLAGPSSLSGVGAREEMMDGCGPVRRGAGGVRVADDELHKDRQLPTSFRHTAKLLLLSLTFATSPTSAPATNRCEQAMRARPILPLFGPHPPSQPD